MHVLVWCYFSSAACHMCYLSVFCDPKSLCLHSASTSTGRFVGGKQLHLTFCFLHRVSDNINSSLLSQQDCCTGRNNFVSVGSESPGCSCCFPLGITKVGLGVPGSARMGVHGPLPTAKLSFISTGTREWG